MKINRGYKTELAPNNKQRSYFGRCAGAARFVYNWALGDRIERCEQGLSTSMYEQKKRFNALKREQFPWIYDIPYAITSAAFGHLDTAYQNFFRRVKQGKEKAGFPKFKRRTNHGGFTLRGCIHIESDRIKLPCMGWIRLRERNYLPLDGSVKLLSVTISEQTGRWFVSTQVEEETIEPLPTSGEILGIDLGIKTLAVCSDGTEFENPRTLARAERKLKRLQRELSRRKRGGQNRQKTKAKLAKQYAKVADIRRHALHEVSCDVTHKKRPTAIVLEDLNVKGMMANHHLAKAVGDASFGELKRQIGYKAEWEGTEMIFADRWFPSSKTCSSCGAVKKQLALSERTFVCENCGTVIDRDLNAARNLAALISEPLNGRGLPAELGRAQAPTVMQEPGI